MLSLKLLVTAVTLGTAILVAPVTVDARTTSHPTSTHTTKVTKKGRHRPHRTHTSKSTHTAKGVSHSSKPTSTHTTSKSTHTVSAVKPHHPFLH